MPGAPIPPRGRREACVAAPGVGHVNTLIPEPSKAGRAEGPLAQALLQRCERELSQASPQPTAA
eukprot:2411941-Prymnesium_polylepis.1